MPYDKFLVYIMSMSDEVWERHANPWSGWTRFATFPIWFIAIWSWTWIGWWAILPIVILSVWTWLNPRIFPPYKSDQSWMTRGVLGERIFINRQQKPIPSEYVKIAHLLSFFAFLFLMFAIWGFIQQEFWLALGGYLLSVFSKMWFVDRMVCLYDRMKDNP